MATEKPWPAAENLARALRMVRASRGLTQARVSAGAGISERTLSEWERGIFGRSGPGVWVLGRVAEFYGVELEDLIRGDVGRLVGEAG